jgi:UDP-glucuronate decarboxylase
MMNILVTGGAGFLGSHLCKNLVRDGNHVTALDNLYTGAMTNLTELEKSDQFKFVEHDVTQSFILKNDFDQIYNLASPASPKHYQRDPLSTIRTNVLGAINVAEFALKNNSRVLQASTSEVYGDPLISPQDEFYLGNVNTLGERSCYDEGKRCAETILYDYHRASNLDLRIVRIFNTYGPNMQVDDGRVVSNFIIQALRGEDITIYGDGSQTRSFCYFSDLISGFIKFMLCEKTDNPMNLGNPSEFTILELADLVLSKIQTKSKIVFLPLPQDDPKQRKPDISKAKRLISWEPEISLEEGLDPTISYFSKLV